MIMTHYQWFQSIVDELNEYVRPHYPEWVDNWILGIDRTEESAYEIRRDAAANLDDGTCYDISHAIENCVRFHLNDTA